MIQKPIRPYEGDSYSIEEGSELILELDARTKSSRAGLNSVDELGAKLEDLLNSGKYVGYYSSLVSLIDANPNPKNGDWALVGIFGEGVSPYYGLSGEWKPIFGKTLTIDNQAFKRKKGYGNTATDTEKGDLAQNGYIVVGNDILKTDLICIDATKDLTTMADGGWERVGNTYKVGNAP